MLCVTLCLLLPLMMDALLSGSAVRGLPSANDRLDCVRASDQCLKEQGCSSKYRTLRQCAAGKEGNFSKVDMKDECKNATEELRQKSLSNCRCRRGMKKEKNCLRIYWSMYQSLQGNDLLEESPYEPVNSRLSDIFRLAPITSDALKARIKPRSSDDQRPAEPVIYKENNCLDAAKACNLNDTCKKYRSAYITPCTSKTSNEICNRRKCHKALRQFFDKVPPKHSYGMLFCACKDTACTERRRQTIVPVCLYEENEKANCLSLQESCKTNYICRSRLADFFTNCQMEPRSASGCLKENYGDCLLSYSGLIGTVMTPNYIDTTSLRVSPWCDCSNSGNTIDECQKFLNFFMENTCLQNAIQAFGNGTDIWQQSGPPLQTTTAMTTVGFRTNPKLPLPGPDNSNHLNNEIPTDNNLPACANLQAQKLNSNDSSEAELCLPKPDGNSRSGHMSADNSSAAPAHAYHCILLAGVALAHAILVMLHAAPTS